MTDATIRRGFQICAAFNILGILAFSRGLTNELLTALDPGVFSAPGIILICVWGLAYLALADRFSVAPRIALVFALEKLVYVVVWVRWLGGHADELGDIWARDWMTGMFFTTYGLADATMAAFFVYVWLGRRSPDAKTGSSSAPVSRRRR